MGFFDKLKDNHFALMAICCVLPIVFIIAAQALGFSGPLVYAGALAACVLGHVVVGVLATKGGKSCH